MRLWKVARQPAWAAFRTLSRLYLALSGREYRYVFILGHMRSGSTLLSHILANHPDFVGAGEMHIAYDTPADLPKLVLKTGELLHRPVLRETYVVDQINHDYVTDEVLLSDQLFKCIILIREPETTLKSMMKLAIWREEEALEIYIRRLNTLVHYASLLGERATLVNYDDLVDHADEALSALTSFLGLASPLTSNYATHRMTRRVVGFGDPSKNIEIGHIVRTRDHGVAISDDTLNTATREFRKCQEQLRTATTRTANRRTILSNLEPVPALDK